MGGRIPFITFGLYGLGALAFEVLGGTMPRSLDLLVMGLVMIALLRTAREAVMPAEQVPLEQPYFEESEE